MSASWTLYFNGGSLIDYERFKSTITVDFIKIILVENSIKRFSSTQKT